jgi:c-di-GMP-binding flagellar brake protein YcgR
LGTFKDKRAIVVSENTRKYTRINNELSVRVVQVDSPPGSEYLEINTSKSINVSANGLLIYTNTRINVGMILHIIFMKPNTIEFFKGSGEVVRVEEDHDSTYKVAIKFIDVSPDDIQTLDYYVQLSAKKYASGKF